MGLPVSRVVVGREWGGGGCEGLVGRRGREGGEEERNPWRFGAMVNEVGSRGDQGGME